MEAIKFSELPSGDKQDLEENDGLPIIANGENRLLSWGQLKKQIARQTHTDDLDITDENKNKVVTKQGLENRLSGLRDTLDERMNTAEVKAEDAMARAEGADATARSALGSAGAACRDAQSALNEVAVANNNATDATAKAEFAKTTAESAETIANAAKAAAIVAEQNIDTVGYEVLEVDGGTELSGGIKSSATISDLTLKQLAEKYNLNFRAVVKAIEYLKENSGNSTVNVESAIKLSLSRDESGYYDGSGYSYSPISNQVMSAEEIINQLCKNQKELLDLLIYIGHQVKTRDQDISAVLNSITSTLNSVVA